jgi:hypothetical protein
MKTKNMKLLFTLEQWLDYYMLACLPTKPYVEKVDPNERKLSAVELKHKKEFQAKTAAENKDKEIMAQFIQKLKGIKELHKDINNRDHQNDPKHPLTKLYEMPKIVHMEYRVFSIMEKIENAEKYKTLLKNNNIPCYSQLIKRLGHDRSEIRFSVDEDDNGYYLFNIFKSAIGMCPPSAVQSTGEWLRDEYKKISKIDSKQKSQEKEEELQHDFHKSLRNADPLGHGPAESIIHDVMNMTDMPHRIFKAVINHINLTTNKKQLA